MLSSLKSSIRTGRSSQELAVCAAAEAKVRCQATTMLNELRKQQAGFFIWQFLIVRPGVEISFVSLDGCKTVPSARQFPLCRSRRKRLWSNSQHEEGANISRYTERGDDYKLKRRVEMLPGQFMP
jgi:hypothetical protein